MRQVVSTPFAPQAIGPYSQAVKAGPWLFVSGQIPLDPGTSVLVEGGIGEQTRRVLQNLGAILQAAGGTLDDVIRTTVFLTNLDEFSQMNAVYAEFFTSPAPARATVQVARLPKEALVEIDAVAYLP